jgi:hypothetical protein
MQKTITLTPGTPEYDIFRHASDTIQRVHGTNYVAHETMLQALDLCRDMHRDRFVRKNIALAERYWDEYHARIQNGLPPDKYALYVDYGNQCYSKLEAKIEFLCGSVCEYLSRSHGQRTDDDRLLSRLITARVMLVTAAFHFIQTIDDYHRAYGYDFSSIFGYASMSALAVEFDRLIKRLYPKRETDIYGDAVCVNAYNAILDAMQHGVFFDEAMTNARELNADIMRNTTANLLSQKYNVIKTKKK